ncbi:MAG: NUDIX domain-containing protein [Pseudomonadota bacterium]
MTGFVDLGGGAPGDVPPGALIFVTDTDQRILLQLRDDWDHVNWPGHWGLFGGGAEPEDQDLTHTAQREFYEEVGLHLELSRFVPMARLTATSERRTALFVYRLQGSLSPADITLGEGAGFGFFNAAQAANLPLVPSSAQVVAHWRQQFV